MIYKILSLCFLFSSCSLSLMAQWSVGVSGGATLNFLEWKIQPLNIDLDFDPHLNGRAAGHVEYTFSPGIALRADVVYQVIGNKLGALTDANGETVDSRLVYTYNTLGSNLSLKISPVKKARNLYFLAGPGIARIISGHKRLKGDFPEGFENPGKRAMDLDAEAIRRTQWIADLGIGYSIPCGARGRIAAEGRYQYGLSGFSTSDNVKARMQTAVLTAGYFHQF